MPEKNNNDNLQNLLKSVSQYLGTSPDKLKSSAQTGDFSESLKNVSAEDAQKIQNVLSDKQAAEKLLSTPKAKELLKKFLGDA